MFILVTTKQYSSPMIFKEKFIGMNVYESVYYPPRDLKTETIIF